MFVERLLSGIILVVVALIVISTGGAITFAAMLIVSLIGMSEFYRVTGIGKKGARAPAVIGYVGAVGYYALLVTTDSPMPALLFLIVVLMAAYVFCYPRYRIDDVMTAFFGVVYVAVMLSYVFLLRREEGGAFLVWLVFLCSWGCDTCAYCVGMLIGKHKMSPVLSPKKSVEGAVGGVLGAALLGVIYALVVGRYLNIDYIIPVFAVICAVGALIAMVGDLAASAIKRNHDVKDFGHLIPGHGGILDRFDSVIFTAPIIYYLAVLLTR